MANSYLNIKNVDFISQGTKYSTHIYYPVWLKTNTLFHNIEIIITRGHHTQTQDQYETMLKTDSLIRLH